MEFGTDYSPAGLSGVKLDFANWIYAPGGEEPI